MKNILIAIAVVLIGVIVWLLTAPSSDSPPQSPTSANSSQQNSKPAQTASSSGSSVSTPLDRGQAAGEQDQIIDDRPATEAFTDAKGAFDAVLKASADYDDLVLEQFSDLGPECSWCDQFYSMVKDTLNSQDLDSDKKSYLAEILAVSGRIENIRSLVELTKSAANSDSSDIFAEALELSILKDDSVELLQKEFQSETEVLKEAAIAAVTNQGTPLAVQALWEQTLASKDPDGYYALGIGLAELIPSEASLPVLQKYAEEKNEFSHLPVKAMLNSGLPGVKMVFDLISNSPNPESIKQLLRLDEALDHIAYEEDVKQWVSQILTTSKDPAQLEFAKSIMKDFETQGGPFELGEEGEGEEIEEQ